MDIARATALSREVSDIYADRCDIQRDQLWYLSKMQEELGELTSAYLSATGRGRDRGASQAERNGAVAEEVADLFAQLLLFADYNQIDVSAALVAKWGKYLPKESF